VTASALIIGGGLAGMTRPWASPTRVFEVHLVENDRNWAACCAASAPRSKGPTSSGAPSTNL